MSDIPGGAEGSAHTEGTVPDLVPARMLNEFVYCPRLFYLEWVQGEWRDSADTEEGRLVHRRVDVEAGRMGPPEGAQPVHARSVLLSSEREHLIARIDLVEGGPEGVQPVDYKKGTAPVGGTPPSDPDLAQTSMNE